MEEAIVWLAVLFAVVVTGIIATGFFTVEVILVPLVDGVAVTVHIVDVGVITTVTVPE